MTSVAYFTIGHEQTHLNRVCYYFSVVYSLLPNEPRYEKTGFLRKRKQRLRSASR